MAAPSEKTVLIVEDDENFLALLETVVKSEGFQAARAKDGIEATELLDQRSVDLIVTDLMMPRQGGYEFLKMLPSVGAARVPVIVVTATRLDPSTIAMMKQEANIVEFTTKPLPMAKFVMALHRELGTTPAEKPETGGLNR